MKRMPFKRKPTKLSRAKWYHYSNKPHKALQRSTLRVVSQSTTAQLKKDIQAILRDIVILRDSGCVIGKYLGSDTSCSKTLQAEHLISRQYSATYADTRNIVCLCSYHHIFFKPQHSYAYWQMIEKILGKKRWDWFKKAEVLKMHAQKVDFKLMKIALGQELANMKV